MQTVKATLSPKDEKRRTLILTQPMGRTLLYVGLPLALYQSLAQLFRILDTMMASHVGASSVSAVAYLSQINLMFAAIGGGLAVGASVQISRDYGKGDYTLVKRQVNTLFALCALLGGGMLLLMVPFSGQLLRLVNTPEAFIEEGLLYFNINLLDVAISFINTIYIVIERIRGNTRLILFLNLASVAIKLGLMALFVYGLQSGITMIAIATLLSDLFIFAACLINMRHRDSVFGFSPKAVTFEKQVLLPMVRLSLPVTVEKFTFAFGKVVVNSMSAIYGADVVGALGISNNIGGLTTNPQNGFQDAGASVISQNLGAKKANRALTAFKKLLLINVSIGTVGCILTLVFLPGIAQLFAPANPEFAALIRSIYRFEALGAIPLGVCSAVTAFLYGFGYVKLTFLINFFRVFIFRIPLLWFLQHFTAIGSSAVGIVMMASNILIGLFAGCIGIVVVRKTCREHNISFLKGA